MTIARIDKWTAFAGSLAIPGLGQFAAGNWSGVAWLAAAIGLVGAAQHFGASPYVAGGALIGLGLISAEHAKRSLERRSAAPSIADSRVVPQKRRGRSISIRMEFDSNLTAEQMWQRVSDLPDFLTIDPFHQQVALMRCEPRAGVDLALHHNAFGWRFARIGRILSWHEGKSYAFSDLSRHDGRPHGQPRNRQPRDARRRPRRGFPHVFFVEVVPRDGNRCRLEIAVRGRWTLKLIPMPIARLWLGWVCREHARLLTQAL